MVDYEKKLKRLERIVDHTIYKYRNSESERQTLLEKAKKTGLKTVGVGALGYIAGVFLPLVSGGTVAIGAMAAYLGRKGWKAYKARKNRVNPLESDLEEE